MTSVLFSLTDSTSGRFYARTYVSPLAYPLNYSGSLVVGDSVTIVADEQRPTRILSLVPNQYSVRHTGWDNTFQTEYYIMVPETNGIGVLNAADISSDTYQTGSWFTQSVAHAVLADTASYYNGAIATSSYAEYADQAGNANVASIANLATTATSAISASYADVSDYSSTAGTANVANTASYVASTKLAATASSYNGTVLNVVDAGNDHAYKDTLNVYANNKTQGVSVGFGGISSIGSSTNANMVISAKGNGYVSLNGVNGDKVAIGKINPTEKLDVNGNILCHAITASSALVAAPATFTYVSSSTHYHDVVYFDTSSVSQDLNSESSLTYDAGTTGNCYVDIEYSAPADYEVGINLVIGGNFFAADSASAVSFHGMLNLADSSAQFTWSQYNDLIGNLEITQLKVTKSESYQVDTTVDALKVNTDGTVGINTPAPLAPLHVTALRPYAKFTPDSYAGQFTTNIGCNVGADGFIQLGNNSINHIIGGNTATGGYLDFIVNNTSSMPDTINGLTAMTIRPDGKVGIGTAIPSSLLEVAGGVICQNLYANGGTPYFMATDFNGTASKQGVFGYDLTGDYAYIGALHNNVAYTPVILQPPANGYLGKVGIGTTTPTVKLDVAGKVSINNPTYGNVAYADLQLSGDISLGISGGNTSLTRHLGIQNGDTDWNISNIEFITDASNNVDFAIKTFQNTIAQYTPVYAKYNGYVGIHGNTNPLAPLDVISKEADSGHTQRWGYNDQGTAVDYNLKLDTVVSATNVRWAFNQTNNSVSYPNVLVMDKGKIGFGTADPQGKLDIWNSTNATTTPLLSVRSDFAGAGKYGMIRFGDQSQTVNYQKGAIIYEAVNASSRGKFHIALNNDDVGGTVALSDARLTVDSGGRVGINKSTPTASLDMSGYGVNTETTSISITNTAAGGQRFSLSAGARNITEGGLSIRNVTTDAIPFVISPTNQVGIGVTTPADWNLNVLGGIKFIDAAGDYGAAAIETTRSGSTYAYEGNIVFKHQYYNGSTYEWKERMRVKAEGGVGINTADPLAGLDVNGDCKFGSASAGNYTHFEADGSMKMYGTATVFDDIRIEPTVRGSGVTVPSFEKYFASGSSNGCYLYSFADNHVAAQENEIFFTVQMPHSRKSGSAIHLHTHWVPAVAGSGSVCWGLEYTMQAPGHTFGNTTFLYASQSQVPATQDNPLVAAKHYITEFADIVPDANQDGLSSILVGRLFRKSSDTASDTYTGKVGMLYIDCHVEMDTLGSHEEYTK